MSLARDIADLGAVTSRLDTVGAASGSFGVGRNVLTNGAMTIAQRATSATGLGGGSDSYPTVDRFVVSQSATAGRYTMTQTADGPSGFANCIKLDCTTADTSIASGEVLLLRQRIEGQDLQRFAKGTSVAKPFALSFYVKGNASATYVAELMDNDNSNRHVSKTFAVTTSWNRIEIIFPADTTGAFDDDNGASLDLNIWLHSGSDRTSGTLQETWGALSQTSRAVGTSSFFSSTDNTFFITGIQYEVGNNATPFEHITYGDDLARCQRYAVGFGGYTAYDWLGTGGYNTSGVKCHVTLPQMMRAVPIVESVGTVSHWAATSDAAAGGTVTAIAKAGSVHDFNHITLDVSFSGGSNGNTWSVTGNNNTSAKIIIAA